MCEIITIDLIQTGIAALVGLGVILAIAGIMKLVEQ